MSKPRLLDLFCGAGGAGMGYHRAGFEVVGVDIAPQPRYPFEFHQADALEYCTAHGHEFDAIHASPPCQHYSRISVVHGVADDHPDLVAATRAALIATGKPYVIENVVGAPLLTPFQLCGSMFSLAADCHDGVKRQLRRHRLFESTLFALTPSCSHAGEPIGVYGHGGGQFKTVWNGGMNRGYMGSFAERKQAMQIDWMDRGELAQAIPPAYTKWIGEHLLREVNDERTGV